MTPACGPWRGCDAPMAGREEVTGRKTVRTRSHQRRRVTMDAQTITVTDDSVRDIGVGGRFHCRRRLLGCEVRPVSNGLTDPRWDRCRACRQTDRRRSPTTSAAPRRATAVTTSWLSRAAPGIGEVTGHICLVAEGSIWTGYPRWSTASVEGGVSARAKPVVGRSTTGK